MTTTASPTGTTNNWLGPPDLTQSNNLVNNAYADGKYAANKANTNFNNAWAANASNVQGLQDNANYTAGSLQSQGTYWGNQAQTMAGDYNTSFSPLNQRIATDAANMGGTGDQSMWAGRAQADAASAANSQRTATANQLFSMGINPNSGKFAAMQSLNDTMNAANAAGSMTNARQNALQQGIAARQQAAGIGLNTLGAAGSMAGMGANMTNSGLAARQIGAGAYLPWIQANQGAVGLQLGAAGLGSQAGLGLGQLANQQFATSTQGQIAADNMTAQSRIGLGNGLMSLLSAPTGSAGANLVSGLGTAMTGIGTGLQNFLNTNWSDLSAAPQWGGAYAGFNNPDNYG